jgi:CRISPR/Cas system-associated protein Csm6
MKTVKRLRKDLIEIRVLLNTQIDALKSIENNNIDKVVLTQVLYDTNQIKDELNTFSIHLDNLKDADAIFSKDDEVFYIDDETNEATNAVFGFYSDDYAYSIIRTENKQVCMKSTKLVKREI